MKILFPLIIIITLLSCARIQDNKIASIKYVNDSISSQNQQLTNSLWSNFLFSFDSINPFVNLINEKFDTVKINKVFVEPYTLVFYYSNYACSPCLDRELKLLRSESDSIPESKLCIIGATSSMRSIAAVIRTHNFKCRLFQLDGMNGIIHKFPFMKESMFLIISNEGIIQSVLVPPKNDDQTIERFFSFVNSHFL